MSDRPATAFSLSCSPRLWCHGFRARSAPARLSPGSASPYRPATPCLRSSPGWDYGPSVPGDLGRDDVLGVPRVQAIHAGPLYHTSGDVTETISVNGLERAARFYAYFIDGVGRATRAQIDP